MSDFFRTAMRYKWQYQRFNATTFSNGLIYFLGKIPFVGKFIPRSILYSDYSLKKIVNIIKLIGTFVVDFLSAMIPFVVSSLLATFLSKLTPGQQVSPLMVWTILFVFFWRGIYYFFPPLQPRELAFIRNFQVSKASYIRTQPFLTMVISTLFTVAGLTVWGIKAGKPALYVFYGVSFFLFYNLLWLVVSMHITVMRKHVWIKVLLGFLLLSIFVGGGMSLLILGVLPTITTFIISWYTVVINLFLSMLLYRYYQTAKVFDTYVIRLVGITGNLLGDESSPEKNVQRNFVEGQSLSNKMSIETDNVDHLTGSAYLNALLFSRFKRVLNRKLYIKLGIISVIGLASLVMSFFAPTNSVVSTFEKGIYEGIPFLFFFLYLVSVGKSMVQVMFINCDVAMLTYPFYREKSAIVKGFYYRFKRIMYYNGIVSLTIFFWVTAVSISVTRGLPIPVLGIILFVLVSLTLLFSFHELFIYYILQPFTSDFQVINPVYKIINTVFYFFAYLNLQLDSTGIVYAVGLSLVSILYVGIGFVVVSKVAPKTFKLKN